LFADWLQHNYNPVFKLWSLQANACNFWNMLPGLLNW